LFNLKLGLEAERRVNINANQKAPRTIFVSNQLYAHIDIAELQIRKHRRSILGQQSTIMNAFRLLNNQTPVNVFRSVWIPLYKMKGT